MTLGSVLGLVLPPAGPVHTERGGQLSEVVVHDAGGINALDGQLQRGTDAARPVGPLLEAWA